MILAPRATGSANLSPASARFADAGAFFAASPTDLRSPPVFASSSPRSAGSFGSAACRSTTPSPSMTPSRVPASDWNATIFMGPETPNMVGNAGGWAQSGSAVGQQRVSTGRGAVATPRPGRDASDMRSDQGLQHQLGDLVLARDIDVVAAFD